MAPDPPTTASADGRPSAAGLLAGAACVIATILVASGEPEPEHPEWAAVTSQLESADWPLVIAARYDAANHFVLVDIRPGISNSVARRLACESVRPLLDGVDRSVGFALYEPPDRVLAHSEECAPGA
jgi:hypothetical protein